MNEFDFIRQYLYQKPKDEDIILGVGDDAAIIRPDSQMDIHISADMLLENRHFLPDTSPEDLAHKVLAVNLSDMAAMGATPRWVLMSVALPEIDQNWISRFMKTVFEMADQYKFTIIGGDTTKGPLTFSVTILGETPKGEALRRDAAKVGDDIWVSGLLGLPAVALQHIWKNLKLTENVFTMCYGRMLRPTPRVELGKTLLPIAHAAQDISDGLGQDLNHILTASGVGATLWLDALPTLPEILALSDGYLWPLTGGDDYELVFTAPVSQREHVLQISEKMALPLTRIGIVEQSSGLRLAGANGDTVKPEKLGFDHFG